MAKKSSIEKNNLRITQVACKRQNRQALKAIIMNRSLPLEERIITTLKLAAKPRDASSTRVRNRCRISGRPRGYYRKFQMSRIALRELGNQALIPGLTKSSW